MVELEDATILEIPQDADRNPNELCGIPLPVDLSRTSARDCVAAEIHKNSL
jgi:hypothetical protein